MVRRLLVLYLILTAPGAARAQEGIDPQEVADVMTELEAAGAPVTTEEMADFLRDAAGPATTGALLARTGWTSEGGIDHTARLRLVADWLTVKGRWRQYRDGVVEAGGAVIVGADRWRLAAGQLGLPQGFGLLVGGPGRGFSLTADGSLAGGGRGFVPWAGSVVPQTLLGVGVVGSYRRLKTRVLVGRREARNINEQATGLIQVSWQGTAAQVAALALVDPAESGASLAFRYRSHRAQASAEGVWRLPAGAVVPMLAFVVQGGWRPEASVHLELLAGWSDLGPRPVMAQKHPVFGDWAGQGVAVRGTWRMATGLGLKLLVHRAQGREEIAVGRRRDKTLTDAHLVRSWPGGWQGEARWRQGGEEVAQWSERFPWQPPQTQWWDSRQVLSLKAGWRGDRKRAQLLWRRLGLARHRQLVGLESGGSRSLVSLSGGHSLGSAVYVRANWTLSWGDPVDLVSAVVPFRGYVLPRHWGRWRAERLLGLEATQGRWRGQVGVSWRGVDQGTALPGVTDVWAAWLEGTWTW